MKRIFVSAILAMVLVTSCAAQSAAADAQRIVGTWTVIEGGNAGEVWVFNANGTGTEAGRAFSFGISSSGSIWITGMSRDGGMSLHFAPNGSRMMIGTAVFQRN